MHKQWLADAVPRQHNSGQPLNPVGQRSSTRIPLPTGPGELNNYFYGSSVLTDTYDAFTYNVDDNINEKNHCRLPISRVTAIRWSRLTDIPIRPRHRSISITAMNHGGFVSLTSTLNPSTVFDVRFGFERHNFAVNPYSILGYDPTQSRISVLVCCLIAISGLSRRSTSPRRMAARRLQPLGTTCSNGRRTKTNTYATQAVLTKIINRHTVKFGTQFNVVLNNYGAPCARNFQLRLDFHTIKSDHARGRAKGTAGPM